MDNLTHSLVGLLCGEAAVRVWERKSKLRAWVRGAAYAVAIIGNNLPDLDFTYSSISGKRFGYLLQHRGYTHTLPAALGFALLSLLVFVLLSRWRRERPTRGEWRLLGLLALSSPLLHIAMDFANNYGVHPFWPVYDAWFYGDSFFIVEPTFWVAIIAPIVFSYRSKAARAILGLLLAVAVGAFWYRPIVPRANAVLFSLLTVLLLFVARKRTPLARARLAGVAFASVALAFVLASRVTKGLVLSRAARMDPAAATLDVVATPMPANPFCWSVILVQVRGDDYSASLGRAALWPAWLDVAACPFDRAAAPTAPLRSLSDTHDPRLVLNAEYRLSVAELRALDGERCEVSALLRFARVPYVTPPDADGSRIMGDLRYDRNPALDFSDVPLLAGPPHCPKFIPPWRPPRSDVLGARPH